MRKGNPSTITTTADNDWSVAQQFLVTEDGCLMTEHFFIPIYTCHSGEADVPK